MLRGDKAEPLIAQHGLLCIARAGKNDCSSNKSAHSCAGQATKNNDPMLPTATGENGYS